MTSATEGTITGQVTFREGGSTLRTVSVIDGKATMSMQWGTSGTHAITAEYSGDSAFRPSTSSVTQTVNLSPFGPPPFLTATAVTSAQVGIHVSWGQVSGAVSYELFMCSNGSPFTLAPPGSVIPGVEGTTYLFKVRAIGSSGPSAFSPIEVATFVHWKDVLLLQKGIKAAHVAQLRSIANSFRAAAGLSPFPFTDPVLTAGSSKVKRVHLVELRAAIDSARAAVGLPQWVYTDPVITAKSTIIKAVHFQELRDAVR